MRNVRAMIMAGLFAMASAAFGSSITPPCTAGAANENVLPVQNANLTYCVSDYGWSDAWFVGNPLVYTPTLDLLSGDDALNLNYLAPVGGIGSGTGWISPSLDQGTLVAQPVPSRWTVITPLHYTGASSVESTIGNPDGLRMTINTSAIGTGVQLTLFITNGSTSPIDGLQLADYFNFHPNGTVNNLDGTTSVRNGCIVTTGFQNTTLLTDGYMCGLTQPTSFEVGSASGANPVWMDVQNISYLDFMGPVGPGDTAGALEWDLGNLAAGQTVVFAVGKDLIPTPPDSAPEPASVWLAAGALVLCAIRNRVPS
jgi:hypothetical protein